MMTARRLQIVGADTSGIDWQTASKAFRVPKGHVLVEMAPAQERMGLIYLPSTNANIRPDVGVVIAANVDDSDKPEHLRIAPEDKPKPGDTVIVSPAEGTWLRGFVCRKYITGNQLRSYGSVTHQQDVWPVEYWKHVLASFNDMQIKPFGANILIRRDPIIASESGLILSDDAQYRSCMATVEAVGPLAKEVQVGDRVSYDPRKVKLRGFEFEFGEDMKDLAICEADAFNAIVIQ